ncbi:hypothetical protein Tco_0917158, partial [Tanacetum coccineum]
LRMERTNLGNSPTASIKGKGGLALRYHVMYMEIRKSSGVDDEVVQDQRQWDDNDLQDERQDQPKEE